MQKMKIDYVHCPMTQYEEVLEDIIKTGWTEQCEELRCPGKAALVCPW